ncbi:phosphoribosyl-AMP cyclohydrolase [Longibacter salinarum]|uniref:Phosphoribosyl-AMP cyclohydrolase n=1 Tax=Longibacter salinarum TaxID=1850348 RepID=A0A2A8CYQ8_9BACT|nr:phosphoribosyl-AMP cyclohydrolase [Longibacter salinarum]PEN13825.1 phosphoribosyl-AMP cyclohydrolase [Longibacter salinarum]
MIDQPAALLDDVRFDEDGLVAAIVQDAETNEVLMMAYMNEQTLEMTLETGRMTYWSRSRQEIWIKGATSGNTQKVESVHVDCDGDALLFSVAQKGGACHTGHQSCFYRRATADGWKDDGQMVFDPDEAYS